MAGERESRDAAAQGLRLDRRIAPWLGLWALLGVAGAALVRGLEPSLLEEGYLVHFADRMARGEVLYRDLVTFTGPLPFELLAAVFRLTGPSVDVARWLAAGFSGLGAASAFLLARAAGGRAAAHLAAALVAAAPVLLFPLLAVYFYSTLGLHLSLAAGAAALLGTRSGRWAVAAGALVAAVALCKQTLGVVLAPLLLLAVWGAAPAGLRARRVGQLIAGGVGLALATLGLALVRGDLGAWIDALVWLPLALEPGFDSPLPNFWPPGVFAPEIAAQQSFYLPHLHLLLGGDGSDPAPFFVTITQLAFAAPFAALAGVPLARLRAPLPAALWIQAAVLAALVVNLFPRADWGHLVFALPATGLLVVSLGAALLRRPLPVPAVLAALAVGAGAVWAAGALTARSGPPALGPRIAQRPVSPMYRGDALPRVVAFLRQRARPGEPIFVARSEPLLYFATATRNPTPYGGVIPALREQQQEVILEALAGVRFVVMSDLDRPVFNYYRDELPAVQRYLERHFRLAPAFRGRGARWIGVLQRGEDRGASVVDLYERRSEARAWLGEEGREGPAPPVEPLAVHQNRRPLPLRLGQDGGGLDYPIRLPEGARFQASIGLAMADQGSRRVGHARQGEWALAIRAEGAEEFETLARWPIRLAAGWREVEVDLSAFAGKRVTLRLAVRPRTLFREGALAWWGSPRVLR